MISVNTVGLFPSIILKSNVPYIAYYNKTSGELKLAHWVGKNGGGNCALSSIDSAFEWECDNFYNIGANIIIPVGISMAIDGNHNLVLAFMDAHDSQGPSALVIARPITAFPYLLIGNCGTTAGPLHFYQWECQTLDGGGQYTDEAYYTSVAVSPQGLAYIAYMELDSWYNNDRLKLAFQQFPVYLPLLRGKPGVNRAIARKREICSVHFTLARGPALFRWQDERTFLISAGYPKALMTMPERGSVSYSLTPWPPIWRFPVYLWAVAC